MNQIELSVFLPLKRCSLVSFIPYPDLQTVASNSPVRLMYEKKTTTINQSNNLLTVCFMACQIRSVKKSIVSLAIHSQSI